MSFDRGRVRLSREVPLIPNPTPNLRTPARRSLRGAATGLGALVVAIWVGACGSASEPSAPKTGREGFTPTTLADADAELDAWDARLGVLVGLKQASAAQEEPLQTPVPPSQPEQPRSDGDVCETACDALASMKRATEHVCSLAGPGEHCDTARARTNRAEQRVRARCPDCEALTP
ncbi:MAG: hypothetical protein U0271_33140 [Polyangiaceae bacterium]